MGYEYARRENERIKPGSSKKPIDEDDICLPLIICNFKDFLISYRVLCKKVSEISCIVLDTSIAG